MLVSQSKLGPHCLNPTADARKIVEAGCRIVKLVDNFGAAAEFLGINPDLVIIGRRISVFPGDPSRVVTAENLRHLSPSAAAMLWVEIQSETYRLNPLIHYWEGPNEPAWEVKESGVIDIAKTTANYKWYGLFEDVRVILLDSLGLKAVVGNFSTGTPDIGNNKLYAWLPMLPALQAAKRYGAMLGLHEYSDGRLNKDFDGQYGWNTFRYRRVHDLFLAQNGLGSLPIVLTEFGVDFRIRDIDYAYELTWADSELRKDAYLVGATIYTFGTGGDPVWDAFNMDGSSVTAPLAAYIHSTISEVNPLPPEIPMPIQPSNSIKFENFYTWDARPGAPEPGNTISIPANFMFEYEHTPSRRVTWTDIKIGSPTFGQVRVSDAPFVKPEVHGLTQEQAANIPFPVGVSVLLKDFLTWKPLWTLLSVSFNAPVGSKYKVTWPFWPNLLTSDEGGNKVYADDPAAGWARLRVKAGEASLHIDTSPDTTWYNGRDFAFGYWFSPQVVVDVTQPVMTVGLETVSIFGLKDSDFIVAPPIFELVQSGGSGDPPPVPAGTVLGEINVIVSAVSGLVTGVQNAQDSAQRLKNLIGSP